jgi:hypothetical protein
MESTDRMTLSCRILQGASLLKSRAAGRAPCRRHHAGQVMHSRTGVMRGILRPSRLIDFALVILCEIRAQKWGAEMTVYGYARVSTDGQTLAAQDAVLSAAGAAKVYAEKVSGASTNGRKALAQVLRTLREGDTLIVTRLDRLARSTRDLLNVLDQITKAGAGLQIVGRFLGRHDDGARPADADGPDDGLARWQPEQRIAHHRAE